MMFVPDSKEIAIHLGTNPSRGGMPLKDNKINIEEDDILVDRCVEVLNLLVEIFIIDLIGMINMIVMNE